MRGVSSRWSNGDGSEFLAVAVAVFTLIIILACLVAVTWGIVRGISGWRSNPDVVAVHKVVCPVQEKQEPVTCALTVQTYRPEALKALKKFRLPDAEVAAQQQQVGSAEKQKDAKMTIEFRLGSKEETDEH